MSEYNPENNPERRMRARQIQIASGVVLLLWIIYAVVLLYSLTRLQENQHWISICIVISASVLAPAIIIKNAVALFIANDKELGTGIDLLVVLFQ